jgi:hypothetical protein
MAGVILIVAGYLRMGRLMRIIPEAVIEGFTIGIALIIAASQLQIVFGLEAADVPAEFLPKLAALWDARATFSLSAALIAVTTVVLIVVLRRLFPRFPGLIVAVGLTSAAVFVLALPVETVAGRYGALPSTLPMPALPDLSPATLLDLLPSAFLIAFLAGVESLLSAMVADRMIGGQHRPNAELLAQGFANLGSPSSAACPPRAPSRGPRPTCRPGARRRSRGSSTRDDPDRDPGRLRPGGATGASRARRPAPDHRLEHERAAPLARAAGDAAGGPRAPDLDGGGDASRRPDRRHRDRRRHGPRAPPLPPRRAERLDTARSVARLPVPTAKTTCQKVDMADTEHALAHRYDKASGGWGDKMRALGYHDAYLGFLASALPRPEPGEDVLDVGCGSGAFAEAWAAIHGDIACISLLDPSARMLDRAAAALDRRGVSSARSIR